MRALSIFKEQLKEKLVVYNLNVLGYHTYVVGNELLIVHNACSSGSNIDDGTQICKKGNVPNASSSGQKHHAISNKAYRKLERKSGWGSRSRNDYQMRALTPEGHMGYQKWHRQLDSNLVTAVDKATSLKDFQRRLNTIYRNTEIVKIFGKIKIVL